MTQVRAVYEFEAQPNSGELSISVNEVLTVVREGIQGGWLEGRNARGQHGLFPESYVVKINTSPAFPEGVALPHHSPSAFAVEDNWNAPSGPGHYPQLPNLSNEQQFHDITAPPVFVPASHDDDDFDDWTEEDEELSENVLNTGDNSEIQNQLSDNRTSRSDILVKQATVRMKNINRFSNFVKSGMEDYILLASKVTAKTEEHHEIILTADGAEWIPVAQPYYCIVDKPKKESKLKGLKSFIAYSVKSSLSGIQVNSHGITAIQTFRLASRANVSEIHFNTTSTIARKTSCWSGRYEEDFIEHRKNILQIWVNKVCRHPVLSKSDVWIHFVTCTDEKKWKNGKRKAEKDEYVGGNFLYSVTVPNQPLDSSDVFSDLSEQKVDNFTRSMRSFEESVHFMYNRVSETHKRLVGPYKTNWQKMSEACTGLCRSFDLNSSSKNEKVTSALKETAVTLHWIGDEHEKLAKKSLDPLLDALYSYKGMLACIPDIVTVHKSAISKLRENEKLAIEGRVSSADMEKVKEKVDSISYVMLAEMAFQNHELGEDFKNMMAMYLESQGEFFTNVGNQLNNLAQKFK
uniref:SH3 domain-containing protein n=1 Tax=Setaria digitata TaxID=48799 RepID=A0A915PE54_9BILA